MCFNHNITDQNKLYEEHLLIKNRSKGSLVNRSASIIEESPKSNKEVNRIIVKSEEEY
jgi:hypothetical protein